MNLYKTKVVSDSILDEARKQASERSIMLERHLADLKIFPNIIAQHEASVAEGQALVDRAQLDVEQTSIIAPFSGRVIQTYVAPGDRVLPGTTVIQVADYDGLEVRAAIPSTIGYALRQKFNQVQQVGDYVGEDGKYQILVRSVEISAGDKLITTQLPRAITGLLVDPIDAIKFKEALAVETNLE